MQQQPGAEQVWTLEAAEQGGAQTLHDHPFLDAGGLGGGAEQFLGRGCR